MNSKERILSVLQRDKMPDRVPRMEISLHPKIAEQILNAEFMEKNHSGFFPCKDIDRYEHDLDLWIRLCKEHEILDALNCKYWLPMLPVEGATHGMDRAASVRTINELEEKSQKLPDLSERDYSCGEMLVKKCRDNEIASFISTHFLVEQSIGAFGFSNFCMTIYDNRELVEAVMDFFVEYSAQNIRNILKLKPDFILFGEDIAFGQGPYIAPDDFRELFMPRYKKLAEIIDCPWVFHSDGNLMPVMDDLLELGMNAIHPIEPYGTMDIVEVKKRYGDRVVLAGNLDMNLIANGTADEIKAQVKWLFDNVGQNSGWILTSSNSIDIGAKPENVIAMAQAAKNCTY